MGAIRFSKECCDSHLMGNSPLFSSLVLVNMLDAKHTSRPRSAEAAGVRSLLPPCPIPLSFSRFVTIFSDVDVQCTAMSCTVCQKL